MGTYEILGLLALVIFIWMMFGFKKKTKLDLVTKPSRESEEYVETGVVQEEPVVVVEPVVSETAAEAKPKKRTVRKPKKATPANKK